eukprot:Tamp_20699.p1 GENE.Tamp_20699~~Tamp_20699.p1  ORF type:complete len:151 (-),score=23.54 Tamp_20699:79-531(-)
MWTKPITVITPTSFSVPGEKPANVHGIPDDDFVFQNGVWEAKMYPCDPRDPPWTRSYSRVTVKEEVKEQLRKRLSEYPLFQPAGDAPGVLDQKEFMAMMRSMGHHKLSSAKLRAAFEKLDTNKDGVLSREEFWAYAVENLPPDLSVAPAD